MKLTPDDYAILAQVKRGPAWQDYENLLRRLLDNADVSMRTATGEKIGWNQGEAQFLAYHLEDFRKADELSRPSR